MLYPPCVLVARQCEELLDETRGPRQARAECFAGSCALTLVGGAHQRVELQAQRGQRRAQLVGGVAEERLLALAYRGQAAEQVVEGGGERADLFGERRLGNRIERGGGAAAHPIGNRRDAVGYGIARRENQHRRGILQRTQLAQHGQPVAFRQAQIQQHEIETLVPRGEQPGLTVAHPIDSVVEAAQVTAQALADHCIILDQQQAHDCRRPLPAAQGRRRLTRRPSTTVRGTATIARCAAGRASSPSCARRALPRNAPGCPAR